MDFIQAAVLALLQGLTEFLPISSSAHLILLPKLFGWPDQGVGFDVAVHVGTLGAVVAYFRTDIAQLASAWRASVLHNVHTESSRLAWAVIVGTLPICVFGFVVNGWFVDNLRDPILIAGATVFFALLLWWADRTGKRNHQEYGLSVRQALLIGCAQVLALIPGTSRAGITITAGLALGLTRSAAARFSFLLSIPVILLAGAVELTAFIRSPEPVSWAYIAAGTALAGLTAYLSIYYFLSLVERVGLLPFVVYRLALGLVLLFLYW